MKRAIIFDFGGVLMKTLDYGPRHSWDDKLGLPHGSVESIVHGSAIWHKAQIGQVSVADYWAAVALLLNISPAEVEQLVLDFFSGDRLDLDLINYIRDLRANGHPVALLSNESTALAANLQALGIADLFDPLVISANIGVMKPDPTAYHTVLAALNREAHETVFIDDRVENVQAAQAIGIHGIHYVKGMDLPAALTPLLTMENSLPGKPDET